MSEFTEKKSLSEILMVSAILLPATFFFATAADLPHVLLIVIAGLAFSMIIRKPAKLNDRSIIYFVVLSITLAVLFDFVFPLKNDRFGYLSIFFHPEYIVPIGFYLAVCITFFRSGPHACGGAAAAAILGLAFGGDVYNMSLENERLFMLSPLMKFFPAFFITSIAVTFLFILLSFRMAGTIKIQKKFSRYRVRKNLLTIAIFIFIPLASVGLFKLYQQYESEIRKLENFLMRIGMRHVRDGKNIVFSQTVDLNRTLSPEVINNQQVIIVRVVSKRPPGYLRCGAYVTYTAGAWHEAENKEREIRLMKSKTYTGMIAFKTFFFTQPKKDLNFYEIIPAAKIYSKAIPYPGNAEQFDMIADRIAYTEDGVISPEDWTQDGGYTAYTPTAFQESAWQMPPKLNVQQKMDYTQIPEELTYQLKVILDKIPGLNGQRGKLSDDQIFTLLLQYYQKNFTYKLRQQDNGSTDPVIYFLTNSHQGHCELFAASMTLLLRRLGIPARYVTGFVCEEQHPSGRYYVARVGNAHAWLEAYNRDTGKWVLLEPTPPSGTPNYRHQWGTVESWTDYVSKFFKQLLSDLRRGYFAKAIVSVFSEITTAFTNLLWHPVRGPLFLLALIAATIYFIRRRRRNRVHVRLVAAPDHNVLKLSAIYRKIVKTLRKYPDIELNETTTVKELSDQLKNAKIPQGEIIRLKNLFAEYQAIRYREQPPSDAQVREFKHKASSK
ncbi:MAG: transglutaminase-like domain-containing protein [Victivallaceae bacterium]